MGDTGRALTFVTPEDEYAWTKLTRQGAFAIREIDAARFIDDGLWHYKDHRPGTPTRGGRPRHWQSRTRARSEGRQV
jgi:hypothetical protein